MKLDCPRLPWAKVRYGRKPEVSTVQVEFPLFLLPRVSATGEGGGIRFAVWGV